MKLKAKRDEVKFDFEFEDGSTASFIYMALTTEQIDRTADIEGKSTSYILTIQKEVLEENLKGDDAEINKMISELETSGNIYEFKQTLDEAVGNAKKRP